MTSNGDTSEHVDDEPQAPPERRASLPPSTFELLAQATLDRRRHARGTAPTLPREGVTQRAARETAEMIASDPDLQLEADLAQPRLYVEALEVQLELYFAFDPDLEVDMLVIYGDTDDLLDDPWFDSFDPDDDAWPSSFDPDSAN
jgi:hypothetical protein